VLLQSGRCLSRFLLQFNHVTCVQQYYCLPPDVSARKLIISIGIFNTALTQMLQSKKSETIFSKGAPSFSCRIEKYSETKVAEEYYWAITQAAVRSCCGRSGSSVVGRLNFDWRWTSHDRDKWVPVTTAWRILVLRVEERPAVWRVVANILSSRGQQTVVVFQLEGWAIC
jgi:hypothetical protein